MGERMLRGSRLGAVSYESDRNTELAPRQTREYLCAKGHQFEVPFAVDAEVPITWECKFDGSVARLVDGNEPEQKKAKPPRTHWDMLLERRSHRRAGGHPHRAAGGGPRPPRPRLLITVRCAGTHRVPAHRLSGPFCSVTVGRRGRRSRPRPGRAAHRRPGPGGSLASPRAVGRRAAGRSARWCAPAPGAGRTRRRPSARTSAPRRRAAPGAGPAAGRRREQQQTRPRR